MEKGINSTETTIEEKNGDEYSILHFCTKDTGTLVAIATGVVAVFSYAIKYLSICITNQTLNYWNVDSSLISTSDSIIALLGFSAISLVLMIFANALIIASFEKHKIISKYSICARKAIPGKYIKQQKKELKALSKRINRLKDSPEKTELLAEQQRLESDNEEKQSLVKTAYNNIKDLKRIESKELWINLIISFVLFLIAYMFIGGLMPKSSTEHEYIVRFTLTLFSFLLALLMHYISMKKAVSKELKEIEPYEELVALGKELPEINYPVQTLIKKGVKQFLKNSTFILTLLFLIIAGTFIIFAVPFSTSLSIKQQKNFKMTKIDDVTYASVYSDSDIMVLEEAIISDDEITIDLSKQRIVKTNDISYEIMEFNKVNRLTVPKPKKPPKTTTDVSEPPSDNSHDLLSTTNTSSETTENTAIDKMSESETTKDEVNP